MEITRFVAPLSTHLVNVSFPFQTSDSGIVASVKNVHGFIYLDELIYGKELEDKPSDVTQQIHCKIHAKTLKGICAHTQKQTHEYFP